MKNKIYPHQEIGAQKTGKKTFVNNPPLRTVVILVLLVNVFFIALTISNFKKRRSSNSEMPNFTYYNTPCPDIEMTSLQGKKISLHDLRDSVTIIRFTRFLHQELPQLHYLNHLFKCSQKMINLLLIYPSERKDSEVVDEFRSLSIPIIEDEGSISSAFESHPKDTIIIGKDLKLKFKNRFTKNRTIYNLATQYLGEDIMPLPLPHNELSILLKRLRFKNVENGKTENLWQTIKGKPSVINFFISTCLSCPEHNRVRLMKKISSEIKADKGQIAVLFGSGNKPSLIKEFVEKNGLWNITVGIIQKQENLSFQDYFQIVRLDINPRLFVLNGKGEVEYKEGLRDQRKLDTDFIMSKFKE